MPQLQAFDKQITSIAYVKGFIEADGSFQIHISGNKVNPIIKFTQSKNKNLLPEFERWCTAKGIKGRLVTFDHLPNSKNRAPNYLIQGFENCRKLAEVLHSCPYPFIGCKNRDFLILRTLFALHKKGQLTKAVTIGLKKSLHKEHRNQPDFNGNGALSTAAWEARFGLQPGASKIAAATLLNHIDYLYSEHKKSILQQMQKNTFVVNKNWLGGLIDGDGAFIVTFQERAPSKRYNYTYIESQAVFELTMETNSRLILEVVQYELGTQVAYYGNKNKANQVTSYTILIRKQEVVITLISYFSLKKGQLLGDFRKEQLFLAKTLLFKKGKGETSKFSSMETIIRRAYALSELSTKGRKRTKTLPEMLALAKRVMAP